MGFPVGEKPRAQERERAVTTGSDHEARMLIDGKLVEADSGATFDNVNPATEEVIGQVADASNAEMHRAIDAGRRAFDETDWSTNRARRKECLTQLQEALEAEREELREELILEVGCPRLTTYANQLDIPLRGRAPLPGQADRRVRVEVRPAPGRRPPGNAEHAADLEGAGRRRRCDRPVELPRRGDAEQARAGPRHRQHRDPQAGARHAVERHPPRPPRRRADRVPPGRAQRRDVVGPPRRRGTDPVAEGRPDLLHGIDRRRQADHGEGRRRPSSASSSSSAASRPPSCSTTPTSPRRCRRGSRCASTAARAAPSRRACSSPGPATRKASRSSAPRCRRWPTGTRSAPTS